MSHRLCLRQLTLLLGLFLCSVPSSRAAPLLGVFVGDPYNNTAGGLPNGRTQYDEFVAAMGRTPVLIDTYVEGGSGANVVANLQQMVTDAAYSANGIRDANTRWPARLTPVIGIPMAMSHETAEQGFQAIASGARDVIYRQVLLRYINDGFKTIYVRPGWEMNGTWNPWSVTPANVTGWVKAWQHLVTNMRDYARTNGLTLKVMWNPGYGKYTDLPISVCGRATLTSTLSLSTITVKKAARPMIRLTTCRPMRRATRCTPRSIWRSARTSPGAVVKSGPAPTTRHSRPISLTLYQTAGRPLRASSSGMILRVVQKQAVIGATLQPQPPRGRRHSHALPRLPHTGAARLAPRNSRLSTTVCPGNRIVLQSRI
jgi:hypothetical protein